VGKSAIFHQLAGADVIVSNYPGTTVEVTEATVRRGTYEIRVIDLPGVYSLGALSEDELVARKVILEDKPDVIVNVVDASNLERSLYLTLQLLELRVPMILVLNMYDVARARGLLPDPKKLSDLLGVPVIPTVATRGENIALAFDTALEVAERRTRPKKILKMARDTENEIERLSAIVKRELDHIPWGLPPRTVAVRLLEGDRHIIDAVAALPKSHRLLHEARKLARRIGKTHGEPAAYHIAGERHRMAAKLAEEVTEKRQVGIGWAERIGAALVSLPTGVPVLLLVLGALLFYLIYVGGWLEELLVGAWESYFSPVLSEWFKTLGSVGEVLDIGVNQGVAGILAVMIPYILTFFLAIGILEDVGYLPRAAFLMDGIMHRIGLHGRAVVPMLGGFGCNVPAVMATRALLSKRERIIASMLITMVPCSARTAVILGTVGAFLGIKYALFIYAIVLGLIFAVGVMLNRWLPGKTVGMIMEMPPLRRPLLRPVLVKTWIRMKHFLFFATPILLLGSLGIGILQVSGIMESIVSPLSPLMVGWLGLPPVLIISLLYGFIRKEGALVLLVALAGTTDLLDFMSPLQLFVYALVVTVYVPCAATIAALKREFGWRAALLISIGTFGLALLVGGVINHLNPLGL
jgi:ferrous iron transport protein B